MTSLEHLKVFAKDLGVQLLLENVPNELGTPERHGGISPVHALESEGLLSTPGTRNMARSLHSGFETLRDIYCFDSRPR